MGIGTFGDSGLGWLGYSLTLNSSFSIPAIFYFHSHLVRDILHFSLLTAAKLGAGASSVWREAASSYLCECEPTLVLAKIGGEKSTDLQTLQ